MERFHFKQVSGNGKTGPIPVTHSSAYTCPDNCSFKYTVDPVTGERKEGPCYAKGGKVGMHWAKVTAGERGDVWRDFLAKLRQFIEPGAVWRHNVAGDLPGTNDYLDTVALAQLVAAAAGTRGFTYTHKPMTSAPARHAVRKANAAGFTINLSADNLEQADQLADLEIGPVVVVLPSDQTSHTVTPKGRKVLICPATPDGSTVTCLTCQACANPRRSVIIGFPAHGASSKRASAVARRVIPIRAV